MKSPTETGAVRWVRRVRDAQAAVLAGKSDAEIIRFFRKAAAAAKRAAGRRGRGRKASA